MIRLKSTDRAGLKFDHVIGTGGIGSGVFFSMKGNHTLGRNESRLATLLPCKDFCKQHIILHYIAVLLGSDVNGSFQAFPIGKVGNDDIGEKLVEKMRSVGMDTANVHISNDFATLFSVCFQYPDHTGGNITTSQSASSNVLPEDISFFFQQFGPDGNREVIVAAPEVPMATRIKLLEYGRERGSLNTASLLSSEVNEFKRLHGFEMVDILSINTDEARSIAKMNDELMDMGIVVNACVESLTGINPSISILITDGAEGSYCYQHNYLEYIPSLNVPVKSTAGAGDTFLAGVIAGLCCGLPLTKGVNDAYFSASPLQSAVEFGTILAALSVTSADTIHTAADTAMLYKFAMENKLSLSPGFLKIFKDCIK